MTSTTRATDTMPTETMKTKSKTTKTIIATDTVNMTNLGLMEIRIDMVRHITRDKVEMVIMMMKGGIMKNTMIGERDERCVIVGIFSHLAFTTRCMILLALKSLCQTISISRHFEN